MRCFASAEIVAAVRPGCGGHHGVAPSTAMRSAQRQLLADIKRIAAMRFMRKTSRDSQYDGVHGARAASLDGWLDRLDYSSRRQSTSFWAGSLRSDVSVPLPNVFTKDDPVAPIDPAPILRDSRCFPNCISHIGRQYDHGCHAHTFGPSIAGRFVPHADEIATKQLRTRGTIAADGS